MNCSSAMPQNWEYRFSKASKSIQSTSKRRSVRALSKGTSVKGQMSYGYLNPVLHGYPNSISYGNVGLGKCMPFDEHTKLDEGRQRRIRPQDAKGLHVLLRDIIDGRKMDLRKGALGLRLLCESHF